ncbi:MAG: hypothetical protein ACKVZ0_05675 [Gemmatimonadales bacterium]
MESFEFYRQQYETEWARREQLSGATALPIGALTVFASVLAFLAKEGDFATGLAGWATAGFGTAALVAFVGATYFLVRSYHGYTYRQIASPADLRAWATEVEQVHDLAGVPEQAWGRFQLELRDRYVEAADVNSRNNVARSEYLYRANRWVVSTLVLVVLAAAASTLNLRLQPKPATSLSPSGPLRDTAMPKNDSSTTPSKQKLDVPPPPPNKDVRSETPKIKTE